MKRRTMHAALALFLIVGGGLVGGAVFGAEPPPTERDAQDPMAQALDLVRGMLTNAQAKLNRGAAGVEMTESGVVRTPARTCCSGNLQFIDDGIKKLRALVRERGVCFERRHDREGVEIVNLVNQDLRSLTRAVEMFADATNPADTQGALHACTRAFLNLNRSLGSLKNAKASEECSG